MLGKSFLLFAAAFLSFQEGALACPPRGQRSIRIEGTVSAVQQGEVEIAVGRRSEPLLVTERTRILRGGSEIDVTDLQTGDRVVVHGVRLGSARIEAREIRTGSQTDSAPMGKTPSSGGHNH
jgi:hypothetical protein